MTFAQKSFPVYSIISDYRSNQSWTQVERLDLFSGTSLDAVYRYDQVQAKFTSGQGQSDELMAACAIDKRNQRLYLAPMNKNELRYIDLENTRTGIHIISTQELVPGADMKEIGNQVTRMTVDLKGNGYALTNDARHLIRFNTAGKLQIEDLGALIDDPANNSSSVHDRCISWGGDIVADTKGDLFLVTANRALFFIQVKTKKASFKGYISGLPKNYTTNGAAADQDGKLIVGSSNSKEGYYAIDLQSLTASRVDAGADVLSVADLASEYVIGQSKAEYITLARDEVIKNSAIQVFPNPVLTGKFRIRFDGIAKGKYELQLFDLNGILVKQQTIQINNSRQTESILVQGMLAKGLYMLKINGQKSGIVYSDKLMVQ